MKLLRERGERGVTSRELLFECFIMRPGSRIFDCREMGAVIETRQDAHGVATYILRAEPAEPRPLPAYGQREPRPQQESLFAEVRT
jgi:hypothetical protein